MQYLAVPVLIYVPIGERSIDQAEVDLANQLNNTGNTFFFAEDYQNAIVDYDPEGDEDLSGMIGTVCENETASNPL